jgi:hypothetical protein
MVASGWRVHKTGVPRAAGLAAGPSGYTWGVVQAIPEPLVPRGLAIRLAADIAVVAWVALWIVFGVSVARDVRGLTSVSDTIVVAASTVDRTADALTPLAKLPFVGDRIQQAQAGIHQAAEDARANAATSRQSIQDLARLLGWAVALAPTVPIVVGYAALRYFDARRHRRWRHRATTLDEDLAEATGVVP